MKKLNFFIIILGLLALLFFAQRAECQTVKKDTLPPVITAGKDTVITVRTTTTIAAVTVIVPGSTIVSENSVVKPFKSTTTTPIPPNPTPGNTYPLSFTAIPFTDPDVNAPARGVEQWHNANEINVPVEGTNTARLDVYYRFVWTKLEGRTQGSYNWSYFDGLVNGAIARRQKMSFGIMSVFPGNEQEAGGQTFANGGGMGCYPEYLHNLMQGESVKDFLVNGTWTPNYNSLNYYNRLLALHTALNSHIDATTFNGVRYKDVINIIDIRSYGAWGEWHSGYLPNNNVLLDYPAGTFPTDAGFKRLVDAHTLGFPNTQLVAMIAAFDAHYLQNTWNSPYVAEYILNVAKNNVGPIGWRRDQWASMESYLDAFLINNNRNYNGGTAFSVPIMERYKYAPITGEPPNYAPTSSAINDYIDLEPQIRKYHAASFGNGNYGTFTYNNTIKDRVRAASKAAGYRLILTGGEVVTTATTIQIKLNWQNTGIAPTYENWNVIYELVNAAGNIAWSTGSAFKPRLFLPLAAPTAITDNYPVNVPAGTYTLRMAIKDPANYRGFLPLALRNTNPDNSINLKTGIVF